MPGWVRTLQPLLSGVFTVDNLDYVRRDAYLTGVSMGPVDAERLRRYTFVSGRGLTLYESGIGALEMFLTARLFMYQHVYLHRTVRAIDLDLEEVFAPSIRGGVRRRVAGGAARGVRGPRRVRAAPPGGAAGPEASTSPPRRSPGDGTVTRDVADGWRAILLRRPRWRGEHEVRTRGRDVATGRQALLDELGGGRARAGADRPHRRRRPAGRLEAAHARDRAARRRRRAHARRGAVAPAGVAPHRAALPAGRVARSAPIAGVPALWYQGRLTIRNR